MSISNIGFLPNKGTYVRGCYSLLAIHDYNISVAWAIMLFVQLFYALFLRFIINIGVFIGVLYSTLHDLLMVLCVG